MIFDRRKIISILHDRDRGFLKKDVISLIAEKGMSTDKEQLNSLADDVLSDDSLFFMQDEAEKYYFNDQLENFPTIGGEPSKPNYAPKSITQNIGALGLRNTYDRDEQKSNLIEMMDHLDKFKKGEFGAVLNRNQRARLDNMSRRNKHPQGIKENELQLERYREAVSNGDFLKSHSPEEVMFAARAHEELGLSSEKQKEHWRSVGSIATGNVEQYSLDKARESKFKNELESLREKDEVYNKLSEKINEAKKDPHLAPIIKEIENEKSLSLKEFQSFSSEQNQAQETPLELDKLRESTPLDTTHDYSKNNDHEWTDEEIKQELEAEDNFSQEELENYQEARKEHLEKLNSQYSENKDSSDNIANFMSKHAEKNQSLDLDSDKDIKHENNTEEDVGLDVKEQELQGHHEEASNDTELNLNKETPSSISNEPSKNINIERQTDEVTTASSHRQSNDEMANIPKSEEAKQQESSKNIYKAFQERSERNQEATTPKEQEKDAQNAPENETQNEENQDRNLPETLEVNSMENNISPKESDSQNEQVMNNQKELHYQEINQHDVLQEQEDQSYEQQEKEHAQEHEQYESLSFLDQQLEKMDTETLQEDRDDVTPEQDSKLDSMMSQIENRQEQEQEQEQEVEKTHKQEEDKGMTR